MYKQLNNNGNDPAHYSQLRADVESVIFNDALTAYKIEQLSGVSRSTITRIKNGERFIDSLALETAEKIAIVARQQLTEK